MGSAADHFAATEEATQRQLDALLGIAPSQRVATNVPGRAEARILAPIVDSNGAEYVATYQQSQRLPQPAQSQPAPQGPPPAAPQTSGNDPGAPLVQADGEQYIENEAYQLGGLYNSVNMFSTAGLVIGAEGTFLAPINDPHQRVTLTNLVSGASQTGDASPTFGAGVRSWIGMQNQGFGFRVQHWHFGNQVFTPDPVIQFNADPAFSRGSYLSAGTVDVELTQRLNFPSMWVDASFGGRYARLQRNSTVVGYGAVDDNVNAYGLAMGGNELEGAGFTFSLATYNPIPCHCGWNSYFRFRGSLLWADTAATVLTEANVVTKAPIGAFSANSQDKAHVTLDHAENIFIAGVQAGLMYQQPIECTPALLFFKMGFEYQHWNTGNVRAESTSFAFLQGASPDFGGRVDATAVAHDGDLDLIGFVVGAGLTY